MESGTDEASRLSGYKLFRSWVSFQKISVDHHGEKYWSFYDFGPKDVAPIVMLPGVTGTADVFYRQFLCLCPKGYRLIAVNCPPYFSHADWLHGFDRFLDAIKLPKVHLFGTGLGGFLSQLYAQYKPFRVLSLVLNNTFCDSSYYAQSIPCSPSTISYFPEFYLKRMLLSNFPSEELPLNIADSVDFVVEHFERLSQPEVASRISLNCIPTLVGDVKLMRSNITVIVVNDDSATPQELVDEILKKYAGSRRADIRSGGNFPYIAAADDFNLHLEVHMRHYENKINQEKEAAGIPGSQ